MGTRLRRWILGTLLLALLLYLGLTLLLNTPSLKNRVLSDLRQDLPGQITAGFVYLNWKLHPSVRWLNYRDAERPTPAVLSISARSLQIDVDYGALLRTITGDGPRGSYLEGIRLGSLDMTVRPGGREEFDLPAGFGFPGMPITVAHWTLEVRSHRFAPLVISGPSGSYRLDKGVHLEARRLASKTVDLDIVIPAHGRFRVDVRARELSLPDRIWELSGDRWTGEIQFRPRRGQGVVTAHLTGSPGRIQNVSLPPVQLESRLLYGDTQTRVQTLRVESDYFRSNWTGSVGHAHGSLDIRGSLQLTLGDLFNRVVFQPPFDRVSVVDEFRLTGDFELGGTLARPRFNGTLSLPRTTLSFNLPDRRERVTLKGWEGRYEAGEISFLEGSARSGPRVFHLQKGYTTISSGEIVTSVTGTLSRGDTNPASPLLKPLTRFLGDFQSYELPINLSFIMGSQSIEAALGVDDGRVSYASGSFRNITLLSSFTSNQPSVGTLSGRFEGPDGNRFELSGDLGKSLRVQGAVQRLDRWLSVLLPGRVDPPAVLLEGVKLRGELRPGEENPYEFQLASSDGRLRVNSLTEPEWSLSTRLSVDSGQLDVHRFTLRGDTGSLDVEGSIRLAPASGSGQWDLRTSANQFDCAFLVSELYGSLLPVRGRVDVRGRLTGPLSRPRYRGSLREGFLALDYLTVRPFRFDFSGTGTRLDVRDVWGSLAGGTIRGRVNYSGRGGLSLDMEFTDLRIAGLAPPGTWVRESIQGHLSGSLKVMNLLQARSEWEGRVSLASSDLVIESIPSVQKLEQIASRSFLEDPHPVEPFRFEYTLESGVLQVDSLKLKSHDVELTGSGDVDLRGPLNGKLTLVLREGALRRNVQDILGDFYRQIGLNEEKSLTLPLRLKGSIMEPELRVDESEINRNYRRNLIESIFSEELGHPLNEILDEIPFFD